MAEFSGFTPREAPELPSDPNENLTITNTITSGFFVGNGSGLTGVSVSGISTTGTSTFNNISISGITTIGLGSTSTPSNSQLSFELTSNTNLRIKVRGTDGVLRSANITLA